MQLKSKTSMSMNSLAQLANVSNNFLINQITYVGYTNTTFSHTLTCHLSDNISIKSVITNQHNYKIQEEI